MNKKIKKTFLSIFLLLLVSSVSAFEDKGFIESGLDTLEGKEASYGITFDRTITHIGFNFYQAFTRLWMAEQLSGRHTLTIRETPTARHGSIIWIEEGSKPLHRLNIGLRNNGVTEKVAESLQVTLKALSNSTLNTNSF